MNRTAKVSLFVLSVLLLFLPAIAAAVPPDVSLGSAVVDGNYAEWDLTADYFAPMHRAGNPSKPLESNLYLRYDCFTGTMYALVLMVPGHIGYIDSLLTTSWVAINGQNNKVVNELSGNNGVPPDFSWVGKGFDGNPWHVLGYEASFHILAGTYLIIAHTGVWDGTAQTSATIGCPGTGPTLIVPICFTAVESTTWGMIKALYR